MPLCFPNFNVFSFSHSICMVNHIIGDYSLRLGKREFRVTVELIMPEVKIIDKSNLIDIGKPQLRMVDLNLLTVFDAVMQEQNITRAAHSLGMSQPAVSNAVARLKVMFNDELFVRYGRGIQPTARAFQLFGSVRQALQLVQNELPGSGFG